MKYLSLNKVVGKSLLIPTLFAVLELTFDTSLITMMQLYCLLPKLVYSTISEDETPQWKLSESLGWRNATIFMTASLWWAHLICQKMYLWNLSVILQHLPSIGKVLLWYWLLYCEAWCDNILSVIFFPPGYHQIAGEKSRSWHTMLSTTLQW